MTTRASDFEQVVLVMVGKPARGKSYTASKIAGYLRWQGVKARVFNVGAYRRERLGAGQDHAFFDPDNPEGVAARRLMAEQALDDLVAWMRDGGQVALYDATNSTRARRDWVRERCARAGLQPLLVELVCEDPEVIEGNIVATKVTSPDYHGRDPYRAVADFRARIGHYERVYEQVHDEEGPYVQLIDAGRKAVVHQVRGYLRGRLVTFLLNLHLVPRPIYLTRHGQSLFNLDARIGGDPDLSPAGALYAEALGRFCADQLGDSPYRVWTSTLVRTVQTAAHVPRPSTPLKSLDEIDAGTFDGWTYAEIEQRRPDEFAARRADKFGYRYPRGESYADVITRLDPVVLALERSRDPVLVIAHQAVLRALYAYFQHIEPQRCPHLAVPLHTVMRLLPGAYGCEERRFALGPTSREPAH